MVRPEDRAAYRRFVRAHHPDVGGDPEVFAAGLAELRGSADDRFDAPVVFAARPRGPRGLLGRLLRWARRRRRPRVH